MAIGGCDNSAVAALNASLKSLGPQLEVLHKDKLDKLQVSNLDLTILCWGGPVKCELGSGSGFILQAQDFAGFVWPGLRAWGMDCGIRPKTRTTRARARCGLPYIIHYIYAFFILVSLSVLNSHHNNH
jgi:hypothetical protein